MAVCSCVSCRQKQKISSAVAHSDPGRFLQSTSVRPEQGSSLRGVKECWRLTSNLCHTQPHHTASTQEKRPNMKIGPFAQEGGQPKPRGEWLTKVFGNNDFCSNHLPALTVNPEVNRMWHARAIVNVNTLRFTLESSVWNSPWTRPQPKILTCIPLPVWLFYCSRTSAQLQHAVPQKNEQNKTPEVSCDVYQDCSACHC